MLDEETTDPEKETNPHLHDGNGLVIHRHKAGQSIGEFLKAIDIDATNQCVKLDDGTRRKKKVIDLAELTESIEKVILGPERRSRIVNDAEKKVIAYHEAGHALVASSLPNADPVQKAISV
jgi:hypothetical protein